MEQKTKKMNNLKTQELKIKAALFDELIEFIEDKSLGYLMKLTEKEKNIPKKEAKKLLSS